MTDPDSDDRARKERSPSFPFIPLRKAIERAQAMLNMHRKNATRISSLGETWGYSPSSSGLIQTIAALKAYGLIEDIGRGEDRRIQVSDLASRIVNDTRPGARDAAIKEAALKPKILSEFMSLWLLDRPSDAHCISELTLDRGFNEDAAKLFLRIFDDNISFANLNKSDKEDDINAGGAIDSDAERVQESQPIRPVRYYGGELVGAERVRKSQSESAPAATLPLPEGVVALTIPSGLSDRSIKALKAWIEVIVDLASIPSEKSKSQLPIDEKM